VIGDVRRVVDGRREVRRSLSAGRLVDRVAQPDEVVEVRRADAGGGGRGEVDAAGGVVRPHQAVGVAGEAEAHGDGGRRAGRGGAGSGDEGADLADGVVVGDEAVVVARAGLQAGRVNVDGVVVGRVGSAGEGGQAGGEGRVGGDLGDEADAGAARNVLRSRP